MTNASRPAAPPEIDQQHHIVEEAIPLLAMSGIRGATLRDVAGRCGASIASIANLFGNKDGLIAACFAEVVRLDIARLDALIAECREMEVPRDLLPTFLWTLCEEAGGARRTEMLVLVELLLSAAISPQYGELCRQWLTARRDAFRRVAGDHDLDPLALDILGLHLISESSFAVSCAASASYGILARAGFIEAAARLTGLGEVGIVPGMAALADRFFADPDAGNRSEGAEAKGRGAESRARIVDAAASIIEGEGLAAVTNRAVADRAGVSLALTTYHFKSVTDLSFAGILRVFEKVNTGLRTAATRTRARGDAVDRIRSRSQPSGVERLRSRGMAEISLAAARGLADVSLGLAMRQQRGTITHASLGPDMRAEITRTRAASHALWSSAAFLATAALADADSLFDFEEQARFAAERLLEAS
ncbi:MAG: TetR family transcriptional regulator [Sphingobium sp.]